MIGEPVTRTPASNAPGGGSALGAALIRPRQVEKRPPCSGSCLGGGDTRGWISVVAQRRQLGLSDHEAYRRAWNLLSAVNPFPATLGRICPHPCEDGCSRAGKDGAVAVNAMERFLGDWALEHRLPLQRLADAGTRPEHVGVIGAGPAGLSFACQMARRGYRATVYEKAERAGGMLYYGIPEYRLPEGVIESEILRILDLGVDLRLRTAVGRDVTLPELRARHGVVFLAIGAGRGLRLGIPGEDGPGTWTGTEFLSRLNCAQPIALGSRVVVVGGGNTAIDAARAARRSGAQVTLMYRRTRDEMPAIAAEVDEAIAEGVDLRLLVAPVEIVRDGGVVRSVVIERTELAGPDESGRRRVVPVAGSAHQVATDSVIAAVSQQPDWEGLGEVAPNGNWLSAGDRGEFADGVWTGGDVLGPGVAALAIRQGREAAEAVHAGLTGMPIAASPQPTAVAPEAVKAVSYDARQRAAGARSPVDQWRQRPDAEVHSTMSEAEFLSEASRCFSCGLCFGCERCFMFCNAGAFTRLEQVAPGAYYALSTDACEACAKCIDLCPCGFLERS